MQKHVITLEHADKAIATTVPALTVIIPVHNEEMLVEQQTRKLIEHLQGAVETFEVLFVENGSADRTLSIIRKLQEEFGFIRHVTLERADYSTAIVAGIKAANGRYSVTMGIDFVDLKVLDRCLIAVQDSDIVICSKNKGLDQRPFINRLVNRSYNLLARLFFGLGFSDIEGYQAYDTAKVQKVTADIRTNAHLCNIWILLKARKSGLRITEVPLIVYEKRASKFMKISRIPYLAALSLIEFTKLKCKGY
jgi:glycosyltransferase involved in cell wall biosynthesis